MKHKFMKLAMCIFVTLLFVGGAGYADTPYIFGIHDPGGVTASKSVLDMQAQTKMGYVVFAKEIGHNADDYSGANPDFRWWQRQDFTVICRLSNSDQCNGGGTLPYEDQYYNFAQRCANFVRNSPGCHIWIIGNEPNYDKEWPGYNGTDGSGDPITDDLYVVAYILCRNAITALPGHANDQIIPAATCTWFRPYDATYPPDLGIPPFDDYFANVLDMIYNWGGTPDAGRIGGIALHAYTHGSGATLPSDNTLMTGPPYTDIYYHFRVYRNYMSRIPTALNTKPVYITETDQIDPWYEANSGWVRNVYSEINTWNNTSGNQKIRCVALYRWGDDCTDVNYRLYDHNLVRTDWRQAMASTYTWTSTRVQDDAGSGLDAPNTAPGLEIQTNSPANGKDEFYRSWIDSSDTDDYYKFYAVNGQTITVIVTTLLYGPPGINLYLYNPSGVQKASGAGTYAKLINFVADSTGYWYIRMQCTTMNDNRLFAVMLNSMNANVPSGTLRTPVSCAADSTYGTGYEANKSYDGNTATSWLSADTAGTHWIAYDLGAMYSINGFKVNFNSSLTLSNRIPMFKIQSGHSLSGPWFDECIVKSEDRTIEVSRSYVVPKAMRYVRLLFTFCSNVNYALVSEFKPYGDTFVMNTTAPTGANKAEQRWLYQADSAQGPNYPHLAFDYQTATYWQTGLIGDPHWIYSYLGPTDGQSPSVYRTVNGVVIKHAQNAGFPASYNTNAFKLQTNSYCYDWSWTDLVSVTGNTAQTTYHSFAAPKQLKYLRLYITNSGSGSGGTARIPEIEVWGPGSNYLESFTTIMPTWTSEYYKPGFANGMWQVVSPGYDGTGNCLQVYRSEQGSSTKVKVYTVPANTTVVVSVFMKCPSYAGIYWAQCACKLGSFTASDFDTNPSSWKMVAAFSDSGINGNGGAWSRYETSIETLNNTQISVGLRHGAWGASSTGPTVQWDNLEVK